MTQCDIQHFRVDRWIIVNLLLVVLLLRCFRTISIAAGRGVEATGFTLSKASTVSRLHIAGEKGMTIGEIALWEKTGGRSGTYRRSPGLDELDL